MLALCPQSTLIFEIVFRCCRPIPDEFKPCYASVLVFGHFSESIVRAKINKVETDEAIVPCFTSWCSTCASKYWLTPDLALFPTPSAHHAHKYTLMRTLMDNKLI